MRTLSKLTMVTAAAGLLVLANAAAGISSTPHASIHATSVRPARASVPAKDTEPDYKLHVYVSKIIKHPKERLVTGTWNFPDKWAGQTSPPDIAALQIKAPSCYHLIHPMSATYSVDDYPTNLGSLRDLNVNAESPIWNINDYTKAFADQADSGSVSITLSRHCAKAHKNLATSFKYEAIEGGSVVSVSVGWGVFDIDLSGTKLDWTKGTPAHYFGF